MNSVVLIGRLTADPELRYTPNNQTAIARFTLAVDRETRQQGQERQADFIRITCFGRQAELVNQYLGKGRQVAVNGRIQTGSYQNREGQTVYTTDVVANRVEFLGSNNGGNNRGNAGNNGYGQRSNQPAPAPFDNSPLYEEPYQNDSFGPANDIPDSFQAADDDIPF